MNYITADNKIHYIAPNIGTRNINSTISDTNWHHIVCTIDEDNNKLVFYIDGKLDSQTTTTGTLSTSNVSELYIGRRGNYFNGSIDEVRIYSSTITSSQAKQQYLAGLHQLLAKNLITRQYLDSRITQLEYKNATN